jgi:glycine/D-amino acid oxidase-like deaminating enzyme
VFAAGYETQRWAPKRVAKNRSSYAYITDPVDPARLGGLADTLAWESARPYLYLRPTGDGRLVVGGEDDAIDIPARRDKRVGKKTRALRKKLEALRPDLVIEPAFAWGGTFAETADGLPFFGPHPATGARQLFAMAYGGNGINYSMAGAAVLRAWIERRKHPLQHVFGFSRLG